MISAQLTFLCDLNPAQRKAVVTTEGPLLVLAGAGTGKTRVITCRIANLLQKGVPPGAILAVTFTNKAAREMRERVEQLIGSRGGSAGNLNISTFHALGMRILRAEAARIGYRSNFSIADESDQVSLLRTVLRDIRGGEAARDPRACLAAISRAKNRFQLPGDLLEEADDDWSRLVAAAYERYQAGLRDRNAVDFDDLILLPVLCFRQSEDATRKYRLRFRYILVDEYQDTNGAQYRFLLHLIGPERNICVVGDDDQSIYGFRGAEREKILGFERDFPGAHVVRLEDNYRSTSSILDLANAVIAGNLSRHPKTLRGTLEQGTPVVWVTTADEAAEVDHVVRRISSLMADEGAAPGSIAVLFRMAVQARPFEEKLRLRGIPYRLVGGQSYFDRKEVRDVIAYWKAAANPADDLALLRIINVPRRGFGSASLAKLDELARSSQVPLLEALDLAAGGAGDISPGLRAAAGALRDLFARARERLQAGEPAPMARGIIEEAGYREEVDGLYSDPTARAARWEAVEELLRSVERWQAGSREADFTDLLGRIALEEEREEDPDTTHRHRVTLMTLHSAKGLEFPHVFLVGLEEDILPHRRSASEGEAAIEEERRLLYVGITRAQRTLTISSALSRVLHGEARSRQPSRFLEELGDVQCLVREVYDWKAEASEDDVEDFLTQYRSLRGKKGLAGRPPAS